MSLSVVVVPFTHPKTPSLIVDCTWSTRVFTCVAYAADWLYMLAFIDVAMRFEKFETDAAVCCWNLAWMGPIASSCSSTESRPKKPMRKHAIAGGWKT